MKILAVKSTLRLHYPPPVSQSVSHTY